MNAECHVYFRYVHNIVMKISKVISLPAFIDAGFSVVDVH